MKSKFTGMTRPIDALGRIVIPMEIRRENGIKDGDYLEISIIENGILLTPSKKRCKLCGSSSSVACVDGVPICKDCAEKIYKEYEEVIIKG